MHRRAFTAGAIAALAGCLGGASDGSNETPVSVEEHGFESREPMSGVTFTAVVRNESSEQLGSVDVSVNVFDGDRRIDSGTRIVHDLPGETAERIERDLPDVQAPDDVTHYTIVLEARAADPVEREYDGEEFRERLE